MNCLIVDDNALARITLSQLLSSITTVTIIGECGSAPEAFSFLSTNKTDLVFLDVEMPGMSGLELVRSLTERPIIIFTTSQKKYAVEAFELSVADYLIKPFDLPRLMQAVAKANDLFERKNNAIDKVSSDLLFIKENKAIKKIRWSDIYWIEAMGDYVKIYLQNKWHVVHTTLKQLEEKLDANTFIRVHRSYIVAIDKIESIEEGQIHINNTTVPLAESYRSALLKKLNLV